MNSAPVATVNLKKSVSTPKGIEIRMVKASAPKVSPTKKITKKLSHKLGEFSSATTATKMILH